jgi:hypothetical protein
MDLSAKKIYEVLVDKAVKGLYHANTVRTSKTFLEQGGLLSRKYIEEHDLVQTEQKSDDLDKKFNIWDDVFLDAINISKYFSRYNKYGPILFGFSLDLLNSDKVETVRITKKNPIYWKDEDLIEDRYFMTIEDFKTKFKSGNKLSDGGYHITLTTLKGVLPFEFLNGIQIDNPGLHFIDDNGERKLISKGIVEYFTEDLKKNSIPIDKVFIKDNLSLKFQYQILNNYFKDDFKRLFSRMKK